MANDVQKDMRFGVFLAPFHRPEGNPTLDLERDVQLIEHLDALGFDEAFIGEHHSGGWETIGSPEVFIAYAAARAKRIHFGTGVVSIPYHNPLMVAERLVLLDHLTRGRVSMGIGPGALPQDALMLGIDFGDTRKRMEEGLSALLALLDDEDPVTMKTAGFELNNARLHLKPYTKPRPEITVTALSSPSGPKLAGRLNLPMLSFAASTPGGREVLIKHRKIAEDEAAAAGNPVPDRSRWRLVSPMHIAGSREEAERQVQFGLDSFGEYFFRDANQFNQLIEASNLPADASKAEVIRESGLGVIGTPEDAIAHIQGLQEASGEGFGTYLILAHEWANRTDTHASYELFAREVMPVFQSSVDRRVESWAETRKNDESYRSMMRDSRQQAVARYEAERKAN